MKIIQKQSLENPLRFSQFIYRTFIFTCFFIIFWYIVTKIFGISDKHFFLSEISIAQTWIISFSIIVLFWFVYLVFVVEDNKFYKLWNTIKPEKSNSNRKFVKWLLFLFMSIFAIYFSSPSLYFNINALQNNIIFEGKTIIYASNENSNDKRFLKILIKNGNDIYVFQGNREQIQELIDKEEDIIIYQGFFNKYVLINK